MTTPESPLDRDKRLTLAAAAAAAIDAIKRHRKICAQCHPDDSWPSKACDDGWLLAKIAAHVMKEHRDYLRSTLPPGPGEQLTLW